VHELFLQEFRPVVLLSVQDGIQKELILGNINEVWIMWFEQVFRRKVLVDDGLDILRREKFLRAGVV